MSILAGEASENAFSGPARYVRNLTLGLADHGIRCDLHTHRWDDEPDTYANLTVRVYRPIVSVNNIRVSPDLARSVLSNVKDVVQVHGVRNFQCEVGMVAAALQSHPLVLVPHGSLLGYKKAYLGRLGRVLPVVYDIATFRASTRRASAVVVTSHMEEMDALEFGIPKNKIVRIPYGIRLPLLTGNPPRTRKGAKIVLAVSRLTAKNNLAFLITGFARAVKRDTRLQLVIVGGTKASALNPDESEYYQRLVKLVKELQVKERVTFVGWKVGEDLWQQYLTADVFVWTSRYDNFARALVEAAWFGLPIVSTPVGVAPELLTNGKGGVLVGHDDSEGLADALLHLTDETTAIRLEAARNHDKAASYSIEGMVRGYVDLYNRLVSEWR